MERGVLTSIDLFLLPLICSSLSLSRFHSPTSSLPLPHFPLYRFRTSPSMILIMSKPYLVLHLHQRGSGMQLEAMSFVKMHACMHVQEAKERAFLTPCRRRTPSSAPPLAAVDIPQCTEALRVNTFDPLNCSGASSV